MNTPIGQLTKGQDPSLDGAQLPAGINESPTYTSLEKGQKIFAPAGIGVALVESKVSRVDGEKGALTYRGYPIEQLATHSNFLDVGYLLIKGELPNQNQSQEWSEKILEKTYPSEELREQISAIFQSLPPGQSPMRMLQSIMPSIPYILYGDKESVPLEQQQIDSIALMPYLIASCYKKSTDPKNYSADSVVLDGKVDSYAGAFLQMMFGSEVKNSDAYGISCDVLDKLLIVHGDHDQNNSTTNLRVTASSHNEKVEQFGYFSAVSGALGSLNGSRHGKANQDVLNGLSKILADANELVSQTGKDFDLVLDELLDKVVSRAANKEDPFLLPGIGHRIYKAPDPRAGVIATLAPDVLSLLAPDDQKLKVAVLLEKKVSEHEYFKTRRLNPNVDFYSGIVYSALGIPEDILTPMFALGRIVGWAAHYEEQSQDGKIIRPEQVYKGEPPRDLTEEYLGV